MSKYIYIKSKGDKDFKSETISEDVYSRCGIKKCKHKEHNGSDGCVEVENVQVKDPPYDKGRRFPNGHVVYLSPYL